MEKPQAQLFRKRAIVEQNGVKFVPVVVQHIWRTFGLLPFKVILGSFGCSVSATSQVNMPFLISLGYAQYCIVRVNGHVMPQVTSLVFQ